MLINQSKIQLLTIISLNESINCSLIIIKYNQINNLLEKIILFIKYYNIILQFINYNQNYCNIYGIITYIPSNSAPNDANSAPSDAIWDTNFNNKNELNLNEINKLLLKYLISNENINKIINNFEYSKEITIIYSKIKNIRLKFLKFYENSLILLLKTNVNPLNYCQMIDLLCKHSLNDSNININYYLFTKNEWNTIIFSVVWFCLCVHWSNGLNENEFFPIKFHINLYNNINNSINNKIQLLFNNKNNENNNKNNNNKMSKETYLRLFQSLNFMKKVFLIKYIKENILQNNNNNCNNNLLLKLIKQLIIEIPNEIAIIRLIDISIETELLNEFIENNCENNNKSNETIFLIEIESFFLTIFNELLIINTNNIINEILNYYRIIIKRKIELYLNIPNYIKRINDLFVEFPFAKYDCYELFSELLKSHKTDNSMIRNNNKNNTANSDTSDAAMNNNESATNSSLTTNTNTNITEIEIETMILTESSEKMYCYQISHNSNDENDAAAADVESDAEDEDEKLDQWSATATVNENNRNNNSENIANKNQNKSENGIAKANAMNYSMIQTEKLLLLYYHNYNTQLLQKSMDSYFPIISNKSETILNKNSENETTNE